MYFWDAPEMINYVFSGKIPHSLSSAAVWKTTCKGNCLNYNSGGAWRPNHFYPHVPAQTISRKQVEPGVQYIGGEYKDLIDKTLYLSYVEHNNGANNQPSLDAIQGYATSLINKDTQINLMYFYTNAQNAQQHANNYSYICSPLAGSAICSKLQ